MIGVGRRVTDFSDAMGTELGHTHLADTARDRDSHLAPRHGRADGNAFFGRARRAGYSRATCVEGPPFAQSTGYALAAWQRLWQDMDALEARR